MPPSQANPQDSTARQKRKLNVPGFDATKYGKPVHSSNPTRAPTSTQGPEHTAVATPSVGVSQVVSSHTERPSSQHPSTSPGQQIDRSELLQKLREEQLRRISTRNRHRGDPIAFSTTSLVDLELARKPVEITKQDDKCETESAKSTPPEHNVVASQSHPAAHNQNDQMASTNYPKPRSTSASALSSFKNSDKSSNQRSPRGQNHELLGWNGKMVPPLLEWNDRPGFDQESQDHKDGLEKWLGGAQSLVISNKNKRLRVVPTDVVEDITQIPDGLGMVGRDFQINTDNAKSYGYEIEAAKITQYVRATKLDEFDEDVRIDRNDPQNIAILDGETTEHLVQNWNEHRRQQLRKELSKKQNEDKAQVVEATPSPESEKQQLNIYLRPAMSKDIPQMTEIYNWYVEHSPRTCENQPVIDHDMQFRMNDVRLSLLPFLVAVEKGKSNKKSKLKSLRHASATWNGVDGMPDAHLEEKIVGWACAMDFTASDFAERISVELEVYVDAKSRRKGVGERLMDKLLDSCDRGHILKGGFPFICGSDIAHLYSAGGGRDIHKLLFVVRKWRFPHTSSKFTRQHREENHEVDFEVWLEPWLEKWGFTQEAYLTGIGAKQNRFIDIAYMSLETKWQPREGTLYDPPPGFAGRRVRDE